MNSAVVPFDSGREVVLDERHAATVTFVCGNFEQGVQGDGRGPRGSYVFFFQAKDGIRDIGVTGVQRCALPIVVYEPHPMVCYPAVGKVKGQYHSEKAAQKEKDSKVLVLPDKIENLICVCQGLTILPRRRRLQATYNPLGDRRRATRRFLLQNAQITRALETIATLMELKDEAYYRVLAYQRAAESVAALGRPVHEVEDLKTLPH